MALTRGREGVQNPDDLADVICKWPLNEIGGRDEEASGKAENKWEAEREGNNIWSERMSQ